ncbi:hypothetical protein F4803DRAFT_537931 [Xylaria telfairii]|nr:hypothetical protein F4803DRAFT_537931 [Xylaria telfairii]
MKPTTFCSQECAMNSISEVFKGLDQLQVGAAELTIKQRKATERSDKRCVEKDSSPDTVEEEQQYGPPGKGRRA